MATTSDIRNGLCIEYKNDLFTIIGFQHVKPGKGNAFVRTKLKSLTTGRTHEYTFPAGHKINDIRVERRPHQFLYNDDMGFHFMNMENYEQVNIPENLIDSPQFLKEGGTVDIIFYADENRPLNAELPAHLVFEITYTEPGVKGDTATNSLKPATIETGAEVRVPLFINQGEKIKIDTRTGEYIERAK